MQHTHCITRSKLGYAIWMFEFASGLNQGWAWREVQNQHPHKRVGAVAWCHKCTQASVAPLRGYLVSDVHVLEAEWPPRLSQRLEASFPAAPWTVTVATAACREKRYCFGARLGEFPSRAGRREYPFNPHPPPRPTSQLSRALMLNRELPCNVLPFAMLQCACARQ